ncbi:MAG TPA: hypothetical protein VMZ71_13290, partial [Gemmataceae bacterium]|nr:hypothetical protein [Gemmataceae bacterium]
CDLFGPGRGTGKVASLLASAGVVGVWGNHDIGVCHEVSDEIRLRAEPHVLAYMSGMRPRLELGGCHFSHVEPWLDPMSVLDLWYFDGPPDSPEKAARSFAAVPHGVIFLGHFHKWLVMSDEGRVEWDAVTPLVLPAARRYVVVVGPLVSGQFGIYDTHTRVLTPFRC